MGLCKNCGKPLEEGAMFCTYCGSPVRAAASAAASETSSAATSATVSQAAPKLAPEYSTPTFVQQPSTSSRLPTILIVMFLVIVIGVGATLFILGRIHSNSGESPKSAQGATVSETDALVRSYGLASYPGSTPAAISNDTGENVVGAFQTRDTPEQVMGYYKIRFPVADTVGQEGHSELRAALPNGEHVVIRAEKQTSGTLVTISHVK